jgi:polyisoprenyl-phosphate glycosyltransferase
VISVVVPVYNNADTIEELARRLTSTLTESSHEIIFVNDGSADGSYEKLRELAVGNKRIRVISFSRNFGQHPAICAGFEHACGNQIVLMDADLQDRPEDIPALVTELHGDVDVVYTIKRAVKAGLSARITSLIYHYIFSKIVRVPVPANIGTFRACTKKFKIALLRYRERNILYGPLMFYMGFNSKFIEVVHEPRPSGRSSYSFRKRLALAVNSLISYTDIPHQVSLYIGGILILGSLIYGIAVAAQYFMLGRGLPAGITLLLLILILMFGSLMVSLGIIGSYLFRVYQEVLSRPRYLVAETINIESSFDGGNNEI